MEDASEGERRPRAAAPPTAATPPTAAPSAAFSLYRSAADERWDASRLEFPFLRRRARAKMRSASAARKARPTPTPTPMPIFSALDKPDPWPEECEPSCDAGTREGVLVAALEGAPLPFPVPAASVGVASVVGEDVVLVLVSLGDDAVDVVCALDADVEVLIDVVGLLIDVVGMLVVAVVAGVAGVVGAVVGVVVKPDGGPKERGGPNCAVAVDTRTARHSGSRDPNNMAAVCAATREDVWGRLCNERRLSKSV